MPSCTATSTPRSDERRAQRLDEPELHEHGVGDDQHALEAELRDGVAELERRAGPHEGRRPRDRHHARGGPLEGLHEPVGEQAQGKQHGDSP